MVRETAFYDELGIAPDATEQQIRTAYRSMALKYHPDKNNGDANAAEKFKKVAEAYEVLSDVDKRKQYDTFGRGGPGMGGGGPGGPGGPGGFGAGGFGPGVDPMDIFSHFFGFAAGGAATRQQQPQQQQQREQKPPFMLVEVQCSLEELYCGTEKIMRVMRRRKCTACKGHGTLNGKPVPVCPQCKGNKVLNRQINFGGLMTFQQVRCDYCQGQGKLPIGAACSTCGPIYNAHLRARALGKTSAGQEAMPRGVVMEAKKIKVTIVPGTEDSDAVTFVGQGDELPSYVGVGDILVVVEQLPHPCYRRLNNTDLFLSNCRVPLSCLFQESFAIPVELLDGRVVRLAPPLREGGVPRFLFDSHHVFVVANEGMPLKQPRDAAGTAPAASSGEQRRGKLYVCVDVVFPSSLTAEQAKKIAEALEGPASSTAAPPTAAAATMLQLRSHHGPAPSWHTVDEQGNASFIAAGSGGGAAGGAADAKKKKAKSAAR